MAEVIEMPVTSRTVADYLADLETASPDEAAEMMDIARTALTDDDDYTVLANAYRERFSPEEN